jgi:hypothetical protein
MSAPGNSGGNDGLDDFDKQMAADFANAGVGSGSYAEAVQELNDMASQATSAGAIATGDAQAYAQLLAVVQAAASSNLSQAELKDRITGLGDAAVRIARRIQGLASIFQ